MLRQDTTSLSASQTQDSCRRSSCEERKHCSTTVLVCVHAAQLWWIQRINGTTVLLKGPHASCSSLQQPLRQPSFQTSGS